MKKRKGRKKNTDDSRNAGGVECVSAFGIYNKERFNEKKVV